MVSNSIPIAFLIIFVVFSQTTLSNQYEEATLPTNIRSEHVVKTIRNEYGDIYDCVDIYKQPSLYHPLLKNHKIQMRPNSKPKKTLLEASKSKKTARKSTTTDKHLNIFGEVLKNACPRGTVPIRRSSTKRKEEGFIPSWTKPKNNQQTLQTQHISSGFVGKSSAPIQYFAGIQTKNISDRSYYEASAIVSVYKPKVEGDQMSGVVISLDSGGDAAFLNKIEAGWMVNPELYGDTNTRLYTRWTADNQYSTGCYDIQCPGFIAVNSKIPVDEIFNKTTLNQEYQVEILFQIFQDKSTGNWWLAFWREDQFIGYWPKEIVPNLINGAHTVRMGGIISSPSVASKPPMGSGLAFVKHYSVYNSAFFAQVQFMGEDRQLFPGDNSFLDIVLDACYLVADNYYKDYAYKNFPFIFGYSFVFGGHGGDESACQPQLAN